MADVGDRKRKDNLKNGESKEKSPVENGIEDDHMFSDPEDFEDNITDADLLSDLLKKRPKETDGVESVIVVDHVPSVGPDRIDKLKNVMSKIFGKFGNIVTEYYPVNESKMTKGYAFFEYSNPESASEAVKRGNGYKLDKQHIFAVNLFTDFEKYENIPDEWEPPQPQPYIDHGNLKSWLTNPDCYDQYAVIYEEGAKAAVFLNSNPEPTMLKEREFWTTTILTWSPLGTYLATFHERGIMLWGGEEFKQIQKFGHPGVQFIDFSPNEKYLVTFSPIPETREDNQSIIIWEVRTAAKKRGFHADANVPLWPTFRWSHDDKYFARLSEDTISVYETPSFGLLDKKSLKVTGIRNFSWSPTNNVIAYWVAEEKDVPARVTLIEIPSRKELRSKNLFNVADCMMHWQKSADFLCVKVDRYTKAKKDQNEWKYSGMYYNFEVFFIREKEIPVDSVEIKENITAFAWEPVGTKFAIIHGESPHFSVSFYGTKQGGTVVLLKKLERRQCNHMFWAPTGQFVVLAGLWNMNGTLEFVDTSTFTTMATQEHFLATEVEWDPTGRYLLTGVSWWRHKVDNIFIMWSFQGKLIRKFTFDKFCQLIWRPRPLSLLSEEKIKEVRKTLKKFSSQFDIKDSQLQTKASKEIIERRKKMMEDFIAYRERRKEDYEQQRPLRLELRDDDNVDDDIVEEIVEFFISETETIVEE